MIRLIADELKTFTPMDWLVTQCYFVIGFGTLIGAVLIA